MSPTPGDDNKAKEEASKTNSKQREPEHRGKGRGQRRDWNSQHDSKYRNHRDNYRGYDRGEDRREYHGRDGRRNYGRNEDRRHHEDRHGDWKHEKDREVRNRDRCDRSSTVRNAKDSRTFDGRPSSGKSHAQLAQKAQGEKYSPRYSSDGKKQEKVQGKFKTHGDTYHEDRKYLERENTSQLDSEVSAEHASKRSEEECGKSMEGLRLNAETNLSESGKFQKRADNDKDEISNKREEDKGISDLDKRESKVLDANYKKEENYEKSCARTKPEKSYYSAKERHGYDQRSNKSHGDWNSRDVFVKERRKSSQGDDHSAYPERRGKRSPRDGHSANQERRDNDRDSGHVEQRNQDSRKGHSRQGFGRPHGEKGSDRKTSDGRKGDEFRSGFGRPKVEVNRDGKNDCDNKKLDPHRSGFGRPEVGLNHDGKNDDDNEKFIPQVSEFGKSERELNHETKMSEKREEKGLQTSGFGRPSEKMVKMTTKDEEKNSKDLPRSEFGRHEYEMNKMLTNEKNKGQNNQRSGFGNPKAHAYHDRKDRGKGKKDDSPRYGPKNEEARQTAHERKGFGKPQAKHGGNQGSLERESASYLNQGHGGERNFVRRSRENLNKDQVSKHDRDRPRSGQSREINRDVESGGYNDKGHEQGRTDYHRKGDHEKGRTDYHGKGDHDKWRSDDHNEKGRREYHIEGRRDYNERVDGNKKGRDNGKGKTGNNSGCRDDRGEGRKFNSQFKRLDHHENRSGEMRDNYFTSEGGSGKQNQKSDSTCNSDWKTVIDKGTEGEHKLGNSDNTESDRTKTPPPGFKINGPPPGLTGSKKSDIKVPPGFDDFR